MSPAGVLENINVGWRKVQAKFLGVIGQPVAELVPDVPESRHGSPLGFVGQIDDNIGIQAATAVQCVVKRPEPRLRDAPIDVRRFSDHVLCLASDGKPL
jgi:hypothetical protein